MISYLHLSQSDNPLPPGKHRDNIKKTVDQERHVLKEISPRSP